MRSSRRTFLAATVSCVTAIAGCTSLRGRGADAPTGGPPITDATVPLGYDRFELYDAAVVGDADPEDPPAVGTYDAAIDDPQFVAPEDGDAFLDPGSVVFGIEIDGDPRAYPQSILVWHEVVNDTVGDVPVTITYCPLTGSALAFERGETSLGMSNKLVNSNLILYDRGSETWWPQILGEGVAGEHVGDALLERPLVWTSWERWRSAHPDTAVLSRETGYARDYDDDPYGEYDPPSGYYASGPPARIVLYEDDRYDPKTVVIGARDAAGAVAVVKDHLRRVGVVTIGVGDEAYVAAYDAALDTAYVYRNPDGRTVEHVDGAVVVDDEVREPASLPLPSLNAFDVMWFAWAAYYPNTAVVG